MSRSLPLLACAVAVAVVLPSEALGQAATGSENDAEGAQANEDRRGTGWLGIRVDAEMALLGPLRDSIVLVVADIYPGGPADLGGVAPGDRILAANGVAFVGWDTWDRFRAGLAPGRTLRLALLRDGDVIEATVVPDEPPSTDQEFAPVRLAPVELARPDFAGTQARLLRTMDSLLRVAGARMGEIDRSFSRTRSFDLLDWPGGVAGAAAARPAERGESLAPTAVRGALGPRSRAVSLSFDAPQVGSDAPPAEGGGGPRLQSFRSGPRLQLRMMTPALLDNPFVFGGALARDLTEELGRYFGSVAGVLLTDVLPRTPAAAAGFQPGDVIVSVDGRETPALSALRAVLAGGRPPYEIAVVRRGEPAVVRYPRR